MRCNCGANHVKSARVLENSSYCKIGLIALGPKKNIYFTLISRWHWSHWFHDKSSLNLYLLSSLALSTQNNNSKDNLPSFKASRNFTTSTDCSKRVQWCARILQNTVMLGNDYSPVLLSYSNAGVLWKFIIQIVPSFLRSTESEKEE